MIRELAIEPYGYRIRATGLTADEVWARAAGYGHDPSLLGAALPPGEIIVQHEETLYYAIEWDPDFGEQRVRIDAQGEDRDGERCPYEARDRAALAIAARIGQAVIIENDEGEGYSYFALIMNNKIHNVGLGDVSA